MSPRRCSGVTWVQPVPSIEERRRPGLSVTLPYPRHPQTCQACGFIAGWGDGVALRVWIECDEWDRPTSPPVHVVLCVGCSDRLITAHARMYHAVEAWAPNIGAMDLCGDCPARRELACTSPLAKQNGGAGMEVRYAKAPTYAHINRGRKGSGFQWLFSGPPTFCAGRPVEATTAEA